MIISVSNLKSRAVLSSDGVIGHVSDFFFDDHDWVLRYLVVDANETLGNRRVLLSPESLNPVDPNADTVSVGLTRQQVQDSPDILTDAPISYQDEATLRGHYGWPLYWGGLNPLISSGVPDFPAVPVTGPEGQPLATDNTPAFDAGSEPARQDPHLRSYNEVIGYRINANDGHVGTLHDLLVEDAGGRVMYLVVDTGSLFPGKKVLVSPSWVQHVSWPTEEIDVDLKAETVKASPEYDPERPLGGEDEDALYRHYGKTRDS